MTCCGDWRQDVPIADTGPADRQAAVPSKAGHDVEALLASAERQGVEVLSTIVKAAVTRALASGVLANAETLFTAEERARLADALAAVTATAELMGRARVQMQAAKARAK